MPYIFLLLCKVCSLSSQPLLNAGWYLKSFLDAESTVPKYLSDSGREAKAILAII
jgi:hypothetical protein